MKLGVIYNLFDGIELLEHSIAQIREYADVIVVHYQKENWYGKPIEQPIEDILRSLKERKLVDHYILFPVLTPASEWRMAKTIEYTKRVRNKMFAEKLGCTHYLECDVDEFYEPKAFKQAKDLIIQNGYETTSCDIRSYVLSPTFVKTVPDTVKVPFICKIMDKPRGFKAHVDPTRVTAGLSQRHFHFPPEILVMHHMETVRKDLMLKYQSTSRGTINREQIDRLVELIKNVKEGDLVDLENIIEPSMFNVIKTKNIFNIPEFSLPQTNTEV